MKNTKIISTLFVITVIFNTFVRYNHEMYMIKYAKPNQTTYFVRYNRDPGYCWIGLMDCSIQIAIQFGGLDWD